MIIYIGVVLSLLLPAPVIGQEHIDNKPNLTLSDNKSIKEDNGTFSYEFTDHENITVTCEAPSADIQVGWGHYTKHGLKGDIHYKLQKAYFNLNDMNITYDKNTLICYYYKPNNQTLSIYLTLRYKPQTRHRLTKEEPNLTLSDNKSIQQDEGKFYYEFTDHENITVTCEAPSADIEVGWEHRIVHKGVIKMCNRQNSCHLNDMNFEYNRSLLTCYLINSHYLTKSLELRYKQKKRYEARNKEAPKVTECNKGRHLMKENELLTLKYRENDTVCLICEVPELGTVSVRWIKAVGETKPKESNLLNTSQKLIFNLTKSDHNGTLVCEIYDNGHLTNRTTIKLEYIEQEGIPGTKVESILIPICVLIVILIIGIALYYWKKKHAERNINGKIQSNNSSKPTPQTLEQYTDVRDALENTYLDPYVPAVPQYAQAIPKSARNDNTDINTYEYVEPVSLSDKFRNAKEISYSNSKPPMSPYYNVCGDISKLSYD